MLATPVHRGHEGETFSLPVWDGIQLDRVCNVHTIITPYYPYILLCSNSNTYQSSTLISTVTPVEGSRGHVLAYYTAPKPVILGLGANSRLTAEFNLATIVFTLSRLSLPPLYCVGLYAPCKPRRQSQSSTAVFAPVSESASRNCIPFPYCTVLYCVLCMYCGTYIPTSVWYCVLCTLRCMQDDVDRNDSPQHHKKNRM